MEEEKEEKSRSGERGKFLSFFGENSLSSFSRVRIFWCKKRSKKKLCRSFWRNHQGLKFICKMKMNIISRAMTNQEMLNSFFLNILCSLSLSSSLSFSHIRRTLSCYIYTPPMIQFFLLLLIAYLYISKCASLIFSVWLDHARIVRLSRSIPTFLLRRAFFSSTRVRLKRVFSFEKMISFSNIL